MTQYATRGEIEDLQARVDALEAKQTPKTTTSGQITIKKEIKTK